jgi:drug/metabolite transporter (DMT)-like permease
MPRRKKAWSNVSAWTVVVLGLAAGVTMNLVTAGLQKDIISNAFYIFLVLFLLGVIIYSGRKAHTPEFLNNIFLLIVATVSLNLFSTWIQYSLLHDTYSLPSVTLFLAFTVFALSISALLQSHYYRRFRQSINMRRRASARSMTPFVLQRRESTTKKRLPRHKRKKL